MPFPRGGDPAASFGLMIGGIFSILAITGGVLIILGALKMKKVESYNSAMAASIIAMIPCVSPCCILGLPFGIWALVILSKPEIKTAFGRSAY
jgi:hypothetical protein